MFSPQGVPKLTQPSARRDASSVVLDVARTELAPWQDRHPITRRRPREGMTWQFTVYGGLYDVAAARRALVSEFGKDSVPADARKDDKTALFAFTLDAQGCLVENSATLSACAWAISRLKTPGPHDRAWLDGFEDHEREFAAGLNKLAPPKLDRGPAGDGVFDAALASAGKVLAGQAKGAAKDAVAAGAKATGATVTAAVGAGVGSVAGPVVGGIAGTVAGTFAAKLLTPRKAETETTGPAGGEQSGPTIPRLQLTMSALHAFVSELASALSVGKVLEPTGIRVACIQVPLENSGEAGEQNFLNSFITADLARVERAVLAGEVGDGLATYLSDEREIRTAGRVDVRAGREPLIRGVAPAHIPGGRWPTAVSRPLVVSQQFAVNQIIRELGDAAGLFAVNGPPGTGKTTMLRDVLAAIVVERATRLAELRNPLDAFTDVVERVELGSRYTATVRALRPELTGFEIVVATASNDAAANVTAEIPGLDAVRGAEDEALAVDYFADLASHVLGSPAWGLVAAVLGNMKNRSAFASRFWWGDGRPKTEKAEEPAIAESSNPAPSPEDEENPATTVGLLDTLRKVRAEPENVEDWATAVTAFKEARTEVQRLADTRQAAAENVAEFASRQKALRAAEDAFEESRALCDRVSADIHEATRLRDQAQREYGEAAQEYEDWPKHKPGFWVILATLLRAAREWHEKHGILRENRDRAKSHFQHCAAVVAEHESALAEARQRQRQCEKAREDAAYALEAVRARIAAARERWPANVPVGDEVATDEQFQLCAPWADAEFTAARNRLFLAALRLHKTFLFNAERRARGNLAAIASVIRDRVTVKPETLLAVWQTLFLVVPMISTTFASLPRLFAGLDRESFGWLFIDEAGQATPQQAVGGLWRSRRAVIVGDPRQLEPIVTLPLPAQHALRRHHDVHEQWTPEATSAQRVADRHARHGTALPEPGEGGGTVWVGAPLRVHRRCDRPMFEISNAIAYGGDLMVYGSNHQGDYPGENTWIDVRTGQSQRNWVPAEGEALVELLAELGRAGVKPHDIRVISPFRDVVHESKNVVSKRFGKNVREFADKNVGTVHTVQGQEADVVILVLGSAPGNARARDWASEKPNLLNVAASRAKRRLYVIGNRGNWQNLRHFNVLAATIPGRSGDR